MRPRLWVFLIAAAMVAACGGSPMQPQSSALPAERSSVGTIIVHVQSGACLSSNTPCERRVFVWVDDISRATAVTGQTTLTWTGIPAGGHRVGAYGGEYFFGDTECRFMTRMLGDRTAYGIPVNVNLLGGDILNLEVVDVCL